MNNTIIQQVNYLKTQNSEKTRNNIVSTKIENCYYFLTKYRNSRKKYDSGNHITFHQNMIKKTLSQLDQCGTRESIMLTEARAGRHYWQSINLICKQGQEWKRIYPGAKDPLKLALNIGYRYLGRICKEALENAGLNKSLGILHSPSLPESLVYDYMEIWRQTIVDSVVIPLFTRTRKAKCNPVEIIFKIKDKLTKKYKYQNEMVPLNNIIKRESYVLRNSIQENIPWEPFRTQWGNSMKNNKKRQL